MRKIPLIIFCLIFFCFSCMSIHEATQKCLPCEVKKKLREGASVNQRDEYGATPLHYAAKILDIMMVNFLLDKGADPNARDNEGNTPLHYAILSYYEDNNKIVETTKVTVALIDAGASTKNINNYGESPWQYAERKTLRNLTF